MVIQITDYPVVRDRVEGLGLAAPLGLAFLPENFSTATSQADFLFRSETATLRTLFRNHNLIVDNLTPESTKSFYISNKNLEWTAPAIFIAGSFWSQNSLAINIALGLMTNYLTDYFKGIGGSQKIKVSFVVEINGSKICKKLSYEGDIKGLSSLAEAIKAVTNE